MNFLVYHIGSGQSFFSGVALVVVAAVASTRSHPIAKRIAALAFLLGAAAIVLSSSAVPYWCYAVAGCATAAWVASGWIEKRRRWTPFAMIAAWLVAAAFEGPYHVSPTLIPAPSRSVAVIGDSITAGMGEDDKSERWTELIAKEHGIEVQDLSHVGETAASALKRAKARGIDAPVVVLEIGGNDLLGSTSSDQFAHDLEALLAFTRAPNRQTLMYELPLPPFRHEYGRIQRELAKKYKVALIPKRVLLGVLSANDATVDTIHLTQAGHRRMAASARRMLSGAFPPEND